MIYILDTNVFREFFFHLPKKGKYFESVWNAFEQGIEKGTYISVDECYNELEGQFSKDAVALKWISERKKMFKNRMMPNQKLCARFLKSRNSKRAFTVRIFWTIGHLQMLILLRKESICKQQLSQRKLTNPTPHNYLICVKHLMSLI